MVNPLAGPLLTPQGLAGLVAAGETAVDLAGNTFFDVGATGAQVLQNPNLAGRAILGNRDDAATFQAQREARRAQLPTLEPSAMTAQLQQRAAAPIAKGAQALAERFPGEAEFLSDLAADPSIQTVGQVIEGLGLPVMRGARGLQRAVQADIARPGVTDTVGGMLAARGAPGSQAAIVTPDAPPVPPAGPPLAPVTAPAPGAPTVRDGPLGKTFDVPGATLSVRENAQFAPRKHSLTNIVVDEDKRGQGLGSKLLDQVLENYNIDELSTAASSPASIKMLHNRGFKAFGDPTATLDDALETMRTGGGSVTMFTPALKNYTPSPKGSINDVERAIETRFAQQINQDIDGAVQAYAQLPTTKGGKLIAVDEVRELDPDYRQDKSLSAATHEPSSALSKELWARKLAEPGDDPVLLMSGGTGAGKTTGLDVIGDDYHGIFDSNLQSFDKAVSKIDEALDTGRPVDVMHVWRNPLVAFSGKGGSALSRAMKGGNGRTVPLGAHVSTHVGSNATVKRLEAHYKDDPRVGIRIVDNSGGRGEQVLADTSIIPDLDADKLTKQVRNELEKQFKQGNIDERVYRGFKGKAD